MRYSALCLWHVECAGLRHLNRRLQKEMRIQYSPRQELPIQNRLCLENELTEQSEQVGKLPFLLSQ